MRARYDYTATRTLTVPRAGGVVGYRRGDDVTAQAVEEQGYVVGEDVIPARPDVVPRPADDAPRSEWAAYAVGQGMSPTEVADLDAPTLAERYPEGAERDDFVRLEDFPDPTRAPRESVTPQGRRVPLDDDEPTSDVAVAAGVDAVNVPADDGQPERPAASATRDEWAAYARMRGRDDEWIEARTVKDIRAEVDED
jgi:hypothetical protein